MTNWTNHLNKEKIKMENNIGDIWSNCNLKLCVVRTYINIKQMVVIVMEVEKLLENLGEIIF
jgi:hypothetical protein